MHTCRVPRDQFFQFGWRPRAPSLLSKEQDAEIAKHLKDYSKRYDEIDSKLLQEVCRCPPTPPNEQSKIADQLAACLRGSLLPPLWLWI